MKRREDLRRAAARRERERLAREGARKRRTSLIAGLTVLALAVGLLAYHEVTKPRKTAAEIAEEHHLLREAPAAVQRFGCSGVQTVPPFRPVADDRLHVSQIPPPSRYPSQPPASGPHFPTPLDAGVYASPPPLGNAIHSLEHAAVIIWYAPGTSSGELGRIERFFGQRAEQNHVIVAPYDYAESGGHLPSGVQMALVAWHRMQTCAQPSLAVAFRFVTDYRYEGAATYKGDAPEIGLPI